MNILIVNTQKWELTGSNKCFKNNFIFINGTRKTINALSFKNVWLFVILQKLIYKVHIDPNGRHAVLTTCSFLILQLQKSLVEISPSIAI